ncbi:hypothetical protein C3L33_11124, partial [Rhododendron williamsianum]
MNFNESQTLLRRVLRIPPALLQRIVFQLGPAQYIRPPFGRPKSRLISEGLLRLGKSPGGNTTWQVAEAEQESIVFWMGTWEGCRSGGRRRDPLQRRKPPPAAARPASSSALAASLVSSKPASTPSASAVLPPSTLPPSSNTSLLRFWSWRERGEGQQKTRVVPRHIQLAVRNDEELSKLIAAEEGGRCCFFQGTSMMTI